MKAKNRLSVFIAVLLALGCSGKLAVDRNAPGNDGDHGGEGGEGGASGEPGILGGPCVRASVKIEAKGSLAEAEVRLPDRCNEGLVCTQELTCVAASACADSTDRGCVVHAAADTGVISAIVGDDSDLYFVTYGTWDKLGNYQHDGALFRHSIAEGTTTTIASNLSGPKQLGLTSSHAYFSVDGGGQSQLRLFRVPIEGGTPELVGGDTPLGSQYGVVFVSFASVGDSAVWSNETAIYGMAADPGSTLRVLLAQGAWSVVSSDTDVFYVDASSNISRIPAAGGSPDALLLPARPFGLNGDDLYGIETIQGIQQGDSPGGIRTVYTGTMLTRAPRGGGQWQRVRALGGGGPVIRLQVVGDRYFYDQEAPQGEANFTDGYSPTVSVVTGSLTLGEPPLRVLERPNTQKSFEQLWVGTADALFWTDGTKIYSKTLDP